MKKVFTLIAPIFALSVTSAMAEEAEIIGKVSDGKVQNELAPVPPLPDFKEVSSLTLQKSGRRVFLQEVEKPILPEPEMSSEPITPLTAAQIEQLQQEAEKISWFTATATVYGENSFVTWWSHKEGETEKFTAWSNLNWHHLSGFTSFRTENQRFDFLLLPSNGSLANLKRLQREEKDFPIPEIPATLRSVEEGGPLYALTSGDDTNEDAMNFIEGLHELYVEKSSELESAYLSRVEQAEIRKRELEENPPEKQDVILHYWPGEGARELPK